MKQPILQIKKQKITNNNFKYMFITSKYQDRIAKAYGVLKVQKQKIPVPYRLVVSNSRKRKFRISKQVESKLQPICK